MMDSEPIAPEPDRSLPWWQRALVAIVAIFAWIPMFTLVSNVSCRTFNDTMPTACLLGALTTGALYAILALRRGPAVRAILMGAGLFAMTFIALEVFVHGNMGATDRGKQKRTMGDMRALASRLEGLKTAEGYPTPMDGARMAAVGAWPRVPLDGWGFPIDVHVRRDRYVIRSAGLCGAFETPDPWAYDGPPGTTSYRADIVFSDGSFVRFPDGAQQ